MGEYRLLFEHKPSGEHVTVHVEITPDDRVRIGGGVPQDISVHRELCVLGAAWWILHAARRPWGAGPVKEMRLAECRRLGR